MSDLAANDPFDALRLDVLALEPDDEELFAAIDAQLEAAALAAPRAACRRDVPLGLSALRSPSSAPSRARRRR